MRRGWAAGSHWKSSGDGTSLTGGAVPCPARAQLGHIFLGLSGGARPCSCRRLIMREQVLLRPARVMLVRRRSRHRSAQAPRWLAIFLGSPRPWRGLLLGGVEAGHGRHIDVGTAILLLVAAPRQSVVLRSGHLWVNWPRRSRDRLFRTATVSGLPMCGSLVSPRAEGCHRKRHGGSQRRCSLREQAPNSLVGRSLVHRSIAMGLRGRGNAHSGSFALICIIRRATCLRAVRHS